MVVRIGIVAPASRMDDAGAERVLSLVAREYAGLAEIVFHPQCFMRSGHFAGTDIQRAEALAEVANDPAIDAVWFARGGYGSIRIVDDVLPRLSSSARQKIYLGYSDLGSLLGSFYRHGVGRPVHAPMPADILRADGETAVRRTLDYLTGRLEGALEGGLAAGEKSVAFNLTILSRLIGTEHFPEVDGHVVLLEEVSEYMYNIDRTMAHLTAQASMRRVAGVRLGRCSLVPPNEPEFGQTEVQVVEHWCRRAGIRFLGRADIGHDAGNKIVPFGAAYTS